MAGVAVFEDEPVSVEVDLPFESMEQRRSVTADSLDVVLQRRAGAGVWVDASTLPAAPLLRADPQVRAPVRRVVVADASFSASGLKLAGGDM